MSLKERKKERKKEKKSSLTVDKSMYGRSVYGMENGEMCSYECKKVSLMMNP